MPSVNVSVPHNLGTEEAKRRIQGLITDAKSKFGGQATDVRENWTGDRNDFGFRAMGMAVSGSMEVQPSVVNIRIDLPFAALPFKSKIEQEINGKARQLLA
ncbi:MAG: polyhydroxyalkanoic acid system family protein [Limisphaerales bacterium]